ncbi:putative mimitin, mitochondrial [Apostichopus japonicus]|uniref:Putative mimitin, mitochondrial n=1 Tax=Stichopus japonicus TaxID=307972 RepID=A0A2G8KUL8_STIJA|nr:putative mimitin, mitochondrial [Apostichopus japonicus]
MNIFRSIFKASRDVKKLVGTDKLGNKYFEIVSESIKAKPKRSMESSQEHVDYQAGTVPVEWEAWVRGNRRDPPTAEEIEKRERQTLIVKKRAVEVERKDKELQQREYDEGLVAGPSPGTQATGHASVPTYGTEQGSDKPLSTGNEFEPAAWEPPSKPK